MRDAVETDWKKWWCETGVAINDHSSQQDIFKKNCVVAVVEFQSGSSNEKELLARGDVALATRIVAKRSSANIAVVLLHQNFEDSKRKKIRIAVHAGGHTGMTVPFDAEMPSASAIKCISKLQDILASSDPVDVNVLSNAVSTKEVRKSFYESVAQWTVRHQNNKDRGARESVLRHLIKCVFAWILKEDHILEDSVFEEEFSRHYAPDSYHRDVIQWLFHERMNTPIDERIDSHNDDINTALAGVPYLNGSLFASIKGDEKLQLKNSSYFSISDKEEGLFSILSKYSWTSVEHSVKESEQTIDPEILSNLFENLIAATTSDTVQARMPEGTYYTPADISTEMSIDAIITALLSKMNVNQRNRQNIEEDLFKILREDDKLPSWNDRTRNTVLKILRQLSIFDPACGSGEFPFTIMDCIRRAIIRLEGWNRPDKLQNNTRVSIAEETRRIVTEQIKCQDINQMATHITRLRLFVAIIAAEHVACLDKPLPNLETCIVCADSLATNVSGSEYSQGLYQAGTKSKKIVKELHRVWRDWIEAERESEKSILKKMDKDLRKKLKQQLKSEKLPDYHPFWKLTNTSPIIHIQQPIQIDPRVVHDMQNGWDIVVGNPPYRRMNSTTLIELKSERGFKTTKGKDYYNLFCELGLTLTRKNGGVFEMIVPLSISFGKDQLETRNIFTDSCSLIQLRHHDNRPDTTFHKSPVTTPENVQRVTLVTAIQGQGQASIETSGVLKWTKAERADCLEFRPNVKIKKEYINYSEKYLHQWPRHSSASIESLNRKMLEQKFRVANFLRKHGPLNQGLGIPLTAGYFVSVVPVGSTGQRGENIIYPDGFIWRDVLLCALNSHIAFNWWRTWGDTFHVKLLDFTTLPIPDSWSMDEPTKQKAAKIGARFREAITPENIFEQKAGTLGTLTCNIDFYKVVPDVVICADSLYLDSIGISDSTTLLNDLRKVRSNSNWNVGLA